jgi:putative alpha-1,2-mannosidase
VAQKLNHEDDYEYLMKRANAYRLYFDPATRFMRGKFSNGKWGEPFEFRHSNHRQDDKSKIYILKTIIFKIC